MMSKCVALHTLAGMAAALFPVRICNVIRSSFPRSIDRESSVNLVFFGMRIYFKIVWTLFPFCPRKVAFPLVKNACWLLDSLEFESFNENPWYHWTFLLEIAVRHSTLPSIIYGTGRAKVKKFESYYTSVHKITVGHLWTGSQSIFREVSVVKLVSKQKWSTIKFEETAIFRHLGTSHFIDMTSQKVLFQGTSTTRAFSEFSKI